MKSSRLHVGVVALSGLAMAGCATNDGTARRDDVPGNANVSATGLPEGFAVGKLPARSLDNGDCGLFLFAPHPNPRFVFFANASRASGEMMIDGEMVTLARTEISGMVFDQQFAEQTFIAPALDLTVKLSIEPGRATQGGTEIASGALRLRRESGWSMVMPVGGATSCAPS
jgi:hypothetical protein